MMKNSTKVFQNIEKDIKKAMNLKINIELINYKDKKESKKK